MNQNEVEQKIKKYFEENENESIAYHNLWDTAIGVIRSTKYQY